MGSIHHHHHHHHHHHLKAKKVVVLLLLYVLLSSSVIPHVLCSNLKEEADESRTTYIVRVQPSMKPSSFAHARDWYRASLKGNYKHDEERFVHVYDKALHGFSARLTRQEAAQLSDQPGIISIVPDRLHQLHTTRSPTFLGIQSSANDNDGQLSESELGSNVIIGVFDSGIWPEHRSFHDQGLDPISPDIWRGECEEGENFTRANCNNKIIGARFFSKGYAAAAHEEVVPNGQLKEFKSPRDSLGHGTHTASIAAGRAVPNATFFGHATGVASGVAPKARIAVYKVCWKNGCMTSDIFAAFDKAVSDGVHIISLSIDSGQEPYEIDPISVGAFGAMKRGVFVSASAGNEGPGERTVANIAPWLTTVGASSIDRRFPADVVLGDGQVISGVSLYGGGPLLPNDTFLPLTYSNSCTDGFNGDLVRGKIVVCPRGPGQLGEPVAEAGGAGVVVIGGTGFMAEPHVLPGLTVEESVGDAILRYINSSGANASATIVFHPTDLGFHPAPALAFFSSRGPAFETRYYLKPELIAPGVNILAAWPDGLSPTGLSTDTRHTEFNILSGTSMSCPHVSGIAALLKGAHPDWSPAMIRSAMMTTAYTRDSEGWPILDDGAEASVWARGAGHVDPHKASDPGLVYDVTADDYLRLQCLRFGPPDDDDNGPMDPPYIGCSGSQPAFDNAADLNLPAIATVLQSDISSPVTISRTVTHVAEGPATYNVAVVNPSNGLMHVTVNPSTMVFKAKGEKQSYSVTIHPLTVSQAFANIVWSDGLHNVVSPVVISWH
ncbi:Subtilase family protein [Striga hermonthica]|uniref:Subtilase family protein n=1 Tax=Striga hermonthica TaxID=68872 RepID=A0A9N7RAA0_STRHE|nr:Subtilase family protein [Striga hermonthica]